MITIDSHTLQHQARLIQFIEQQIAQHAGKITFADFMQHALYAPGLGYYSAGARKFGAAGDFITAPELGCLFASCISVQMQQILASIADASILEIGAGSGQLAVDVIKSLDANEFKKYYILELSADLRLRQQEKIFNHNPKLISKVEWLDRLPENFDGVIFANEVLDAMPISRFHYSANQLSEYYVSFNEGSFSFILDSPTHRLASAFTKLKLNDLISQPYSSEINLFAPAWINSLANSLRKGVILLCDYGFPRHEYYHPQRNSGTLMCHYKHHCHTDPLQNVGLQDITAHVDFSGIAASALQAKLEPAGYTNLASFLINCGLLNLLDTPSIQQSHELNVLTSPAEMGELFKCIAFSKNLDLQLQGFEHYDKSQSL